MCEQNMHVYACRKGGELLKVHVVAITSVKLRVKIINSNVFTTKIDRIAFIFSLLSFTFEMCELIVPGDMWYKEEKYWSNVAASMLVKLKAQMVKLEVPTKKSTRSTLIVVYFALNPRCVSQTL